MEIKNMQKKVVDSFGTGAYITTEYDAILNDGTILHQKISGEPTAESLTHAVEKRIIESLMDACKAFKELLHINGDFKIPVGGEDGNPHEINVSELDYYSLADYSTATQIESVFIENFNEDIETLFVRIMDLERDPAYEDFFVEPEYYFSQGISFLDYVSRKNNGEDLTPIELIRVDLNRDDLKSALEVTGGINGFTERLQLATERIERGINNEELLLDGDRIFLIRRE